MTGKPASKDEVEVLDEALRSLFSSLKTRALPDSLRPGHPANLLDQLLAAPQRRPLRRRMV